MRELEGLTDILADFGEQHRGWATNPVSRVTAQGFSLSNRALYPLPQCRDELRGSRSHPVHSGDISRARACHSCSGLTSPARLRMAMIASHAADAAERVVV
jgi:hypothetical protein